MKSAPSPHERVLAAGWIVAAGAMGLAVFRWHMSVVAAKERTAEAIRTRDEVARRRTAEERLRIARELHDTLTHSISVIKVQAGVAVHLARKRGEDVPDALLAIQDASREAADELRSALGVLRRDDDGGHGVDQLPELVDRARFTGVAADLVVHGSPRTVPSDVDHAAYRIVQEALTNVTKHAGSATATVTVAYEASGLTVQIDDDGTATAGTTGRPGLGLIGMRERVVALGGRLHTGPRPRGGFSVRAELPTT